MIRAIVLGMLLPFWALAAGFDPLQLSDRVALVAPITGVSIGKRGDPTTWRVSFKREATDDQRAAAQAIIDNWTDDDWAGDAAKRKAARLNEIVDLRIRIIALEIEKSQSDTPFDCQPLIDAAQKRIAELRSIP